MNDHYHEEVTGIDSFYKGLLEEIKSGNKQSITDKQLVVLNSMFGEVEIHQLIIDRGVLVLNALEAGVPNKSRKESEGPDLSGR